MNFIRQDQAEEAEKAKSFFVHVVYHRVKCEKRIVETKKYVNDTINYNLKRFFCLSVSFKFVINYYKRISRNLFVLYS